MTETDDHVPELDEPSEPEPELDESDDETSPAYEDTEPGFPDDDLPEPPHPINWDLLSAEDAEYEWLSLNEWVHWLRKTYGLPAAVLPPFWHRHRELVWELSALHLHWLGAYDTEQNGSGPIGWHADFAAARERLREWVTIAGTRLDRDRPTRQTIWPGEEPAEEITETVIEDREQDFYEFVRADIERRQRMEDELRAMREG